MTAQTVKRVRQSVALRPDQQDLIALIADRVDRHGNRSLVVQQAIDLYAASRRAEIDAARREDKAA